MDRELSGPISRHLNLGVAVMRETATIRETASGQALGIPRTVTSELATPARSGLEPGEC